MKAENKMNKKKWERIKLEPEMREDGKQRANYYLDSNKKEYFYYQDRTGYVVREASEADTEEWFTELENSQNQYKMVPPQMRALVKADFAATVEKCIGEDKVNKIMMIYNPAQELIGIMKLTEEKNAVAKIDLAVKSQWIVDAKRYKVLAVIKRMWLETFMYDRMYILDETGVNKIFLDSKNIAS